MSTLQRRRGQECTLYLSILITDKRGNEVRSADMANPTPARAAFVSSTGDTVTMHIDPLPDGLDIWSRVGWKGGMYNVAAPPALHSSLSRHTRHWARCANAIVGAKPAHDTRLGSSNVAEMAGKL